MEKSKPILFCDFDGVLCWERYWRSLPSVEHEKMQELLFRNDTTIVNDWMRGKYSAEEINQLVARKIGMPFEKLWNIFVEDCKTMQVSKDILKKLRAFRKYYIVILITGNMDSFTRFTHPALMLENYFDYKWSKNEKMVESNNYNFRSSFFYYYGDTLLFNKLY